MSSAVQISTGTEFIQANTTTNPGVLLLPSTFTTPGRILTIKDITGSFGRNPLTLSTITGSFEDGTNRKRLTEPFGYLTLASDGISKWYNIDGTSLNTYTISNVTNPLGVSTATISTANVSVSTLGFVDRSFNTTSTMYVRSTLLYLGSNVIGGCMVGPTQFLRMQRPFNPSQIANLNFWFDSSDLNSIRSVGNTLTLWKNKGLAAGGDITVYTGTATTGIAVQNRLNLVRLAPNVVLKFTGSFTSQPRSRYIATRPTINTTSAGGTLSLLNQNLLSVTGDDFIAFDDSTLLEIANGAFGPNTVKTNAIANQQNIFSIYTLVNAALDVNNRIAVTGTAQPLQLSAPAQLYNTASATNYINYTNSSEQDYGEFLAYNSELTISQTYQVEGYLAWKWGTVASLPTNHPYKNAPP